MPLSTCVADVLFVYLPVSPKGSIVFTTRTRKVAMKYGQVDVVEVLNMNLDDAKSSRRIFIPERPPW